LKRPVRGAEEAAVLDGSGPWAVTLLLPFGAAADEYDLTIFRDGAPITAVPVRLRARAEGTASFLLPGLPAEGRYVVQLAPAGSATGEALEYSFDHRAAAPDHGTSANR
jgi:hypothetical protein